MKKTLSLIAFTLASAASLPAAVTINVVERTPDGDNGTGTRTLTTSLGAISAPAALPTTTYTITGLDLTSVGGGISEQIVFKVDYAQTGGTGVQFNSFGNVSITGSDNNFINPGETLHATISLVSTTFSGGLGDLSVGFKFVNIGGVTTGETWNIVHDSGTVAGSASFANPANITIPLSTSFTIQDVVAPGAAAINLQGFNVAVTVVPEPASASLLALGALALLRRRRTA